MRELNTLTKLLYALGISLLIISVIFGSSKFFKIKTIITNSEIADMDGFPQIGDKFIFFLTETEIKKHFQNKPAIKEVSVKKKLPSSLFIDVIYREKTAQIFADNGIYIADNEGVIFDKIATPSSLPIINLNGKKIILGTNITQDNIKTSLQIVKFSKDKNYRIVDITPIDDKDILLTINETIKVYVGSNGKPEEIVSSLQMILKRFTIEGKSVSKIDFRFDKPIITF